MKKHLIFYIFSLTSYTQLMANNIYSQLGISPQTIQPLTLVKKEKRKIVKLHKLESKQVNSLSQILKYVKTKKISKEKSKIGATINYKISKTLKLELDLSTILHIKQINIKGEAAHFNFSMLL